jgi:AraC family transcriptional regulator, glycine betaine-responsive activator
MKKSVKRLSLKNKRSWLRLAQEARFNAATMAALCGITGRQLERHAQQVLGCTPQQWLDEQRMIAAQSLLRELDTIKEVSFQLGFAQASHFSRHFKQHFEMTPSEFIKLHQRLDLP